MSDTSLVGMLRTTLVPSMHLREERVRRGKAQSGNKLLCFGCFSMRRSRSRSRLLGLCSEVSRSLHGSPVIRGHKVGGGKPALCRLCRPLCVPRVLHWLSVGTAQMLVPGLRTMQAAGGAGKHFKTR